MESGRVSVNVRSRSFVDKCTCECERRLTIFIIKWTCECERTLTIFINKWTHTRGSLKVRDERYRKVDARGILTCVTVICIS